jgi:hypothetical protein
MIFGSSVISDSLVNMFIESSGGTKRQPSYLGLVARISDDGQKWSYEFPLEAE